MVDPIETSKPPADEGLDIGMLTRAVWKERFLVVAVFAVVVTAVTFYVLRQTPIYQAEMSLRIEPSAIRPLGQEVQTPGETSNSYWSNLEYFETQYKILESRTLAEKVVRALRLDQNPHFLASVRDGTPIPSRASKSKVAKPQALEDAARLVSGRLKVTPVKGSRLVQLIYEDADPKRAKQILSTLAEVYIEQNLESSISSIGSAAEWLNNQLSRLKTELERTELALHEYKKDKQLLSVSLDDRSNMLGNQMEQLDAALTLAKTAREKLASRVSQLNRVESNDPSNLPAGELLESPTLQTLRETYISARSELSRMRSGGRGENHPEVKKATSSMETARAALLAEVRNIQESSRRDLAAIDQEIGGLDRLFKSAEQDAFKLNLLEIEYRRLARARENTERLHTIVLERAKDSELTQQMKFNNVSVVDAPLQPRSPVKPRVPLTIALGGLAGVFLGVLLVLIRVKLDVRIRSSSDIEESVGLSCLAAIPAIDAGDDGGSQLPIASRRKRRAAQAASKDSPELWVHRHPRSTVAEAVRTLRTNLMFMSPDNPHRSILITSAGPTDGKTTIASSLAITMAQSGMRVLMLDADLRRPRLSSVFGAGQSKRGLTTVLLNPNTLTDTVLPTEVEGLYILPSGPIPPNPSELLHSENFRKMLLLANSNYDRIIIDSPPLMPVTDAAILSRLVDTTMLVVRSGQTRKDHASKAHRVLRDVKASVAGVVLNDHKAQAGDGYYYQEYYGSPSQEPEARS